MRHGPLSTHFRVEKQAGPQHPFSVVDRRSELYTGFRSGQPHKLMPKTGVHKAMHTELAAVPNSLYHVTRANRVIAVVRR